MQADTWISLVSATVAVTAAGAAVWQSLSARSQAATAKDQAASALRSADAAEEQVQEARRQAGAAEDQVGEAQRSAVAAEEQVELMRRRHEAYLAQRDERDGPVFNCTPKGYAGSICKIAIRMESGPEKVTVRIPEIRVRPEGHDPEDTGSQLPDDNHQYPVVPGGDFSVDVDLRADRSPVIVELRLECTELSELGRSWTRHRFVPVTGPRGYSVRRLRLRP